MAAHVMSIIEKIKKPVIHTEQKRAATGRQQQVEEGV